MNINNSIKVIFINSSLLLVFLVLIESSYRILKFFNTCKKQCEYELLSLKPYQNNVNYQLTKVDKDLGYVPRENILLNLNSKGWKNKKVSTNNLGLRNSDKNYEAQNVILSVGDSYVFGTQVSDNETWQSCLNNKLKNDYFVNGGVEGYGTVQAIIRAKKLYSSLKPNRLLVQTLIDDDFQRDQLSIKTGFIKPYLAKNINNKILLVKPDSFDLVNTRYSEKRSFSLLDHILVNFTILKRSNNTYKIWDSSRRKITSTIDKYGVKYAGIIDIMEWNIKQSKKLDEKVVWLLQYKPNINKNTIYERDKLRGLLNQFQVQYIDTFDILHGNARIKKKNFGMATILH